jgi:hypothetical protein
MSKIFRAKINVDAFMMYPFTKYETSNSSGSLVIAFKPKYPLVRSHRSSITPRLP